MAVYRLVSNLNILFLLKDLSRTELACGPQVSPTATYQEIIQGKNMTLVCTVTSIPEAKISWWYRGLFINNGSTMVSDIGVMFSHRGRLSIFVLLFATNISNNNYIVGGSGRRMRKYDLFSNISLHNMMNFHSCSTLYYYLSSCIMKCNTFYESFILNHKFLVNSRQT